MGEPREERRNGTRTGLRLLLGAVFVLASSAAALPARAEDTATAAFLDTAERASFLVVGPDPAGSWAAQGPGASAFARSGDFYLGVARPLFPDWNASLGLILDGTDGIGEPGWSALHVDRLSGEDELRRRRDPANWRHFLGVEYTGVQDFTFLGGVARSGWNRGGGPTPTGYEGVRMNVGARWRGETWGFESHFAWIPGGAKGAPDDASFFPGHEDGSGPDFLLSLTLTARF